MLSYCTVLSPFPVQYCTVPPHAPDAAPLQAESPAHILTPGSQAPLNTSACHTFASPSLSHSPSPLPSSSSLLPLPRHLLCLCLCFLLLFLWPWFAFSLRYSANKWPFDTSRAQSLRNLSIALPGRSRNETGRT